ncbi:hypothetical protein PV327_000637 [Microctonus hyperodae]|uniref:Uncharacterized protein n=1 Tax=Microctonus hyperodae TaxID=165561 RepID=A0AA39L2K2_MICHY|nr:hypothetical protein PV327_000637 [Microctonus hyperodae]
MHYLEGFLELPRNPSRQISAVFFKKHLMQSLKQLFGELGADTTVDILKYDSSSRKFILRCKSKDYVKLRSALTLASTYEEDTCIYIIHKASASPFGLLSDGRNYQH